MTPGQISLGSFTIGAAGTQTGDWTTAGNLDGLLAMAVNLRFSYGASGGTSVQAYLQTTFDEGTTAVDIACVLFTTASENPILNFSALTPKTSQITPTDGTMTNDTAVDGVLGDRFRLKVITTGTYAATASLTGYAVVR